MQNRGAILTFAILLALVSLYQLSFTFKTRQVEKAARAYAQGDPEKEFNYLDSISGEEVYNFLGLKKFTFKEVKELELNLGLDLRGGMNVTLEVAVDDLIRALSHYNTDSTFNAALQQARVMQRGSQEDFVTLFGRAFEEIDPNARLASIFLTLDLRDKININTTNAEVLNVIRTETDAAINNAFNIIRTRIDRFGVAQPNIQQLQTKGRILVELPGVKDQKRVRSLLQGTAMLEFWETYENQEVYTYLLQANDRLREMQASQKKAETTEPEEALTEEPEKAEEQVAEQDTVSEQESSLLAELEAAGDTTQAGLDDLENFREEFPLFAVLNPSTDQQGQLFPGPAIGIAHSRDTAKVNEYLNREQIKSIFPRDMMFRWTAKSTDQAGNYYRLIALKANTRDGRAPLDGDVITDARQDFDQFGSNPEVSMTMNSEGAKTWQRLTKENIGKSIAIVLDGYVRSFPTVQNEISGGRSSITGLETIEEAKDLANILKSGKMPAPARIIQEEIVGPSLGQEAIKSGLYSFILAFILVLAYMFFFYSRHAGFAADVALLTNMFFVIGILASLGATLTLPGIAGIVLTIGMAVDANVLIFERVQDELYAGKGIKLAISDGYKNAYSAIIDGQVTTLLTGIILYIFGSGPIKGFATTLIIGILTSLFTAIFITRIIFSWWLQRNKKIKFSNPKTANILRNTTINFLRKRKIAYVISGSLILISLGSIALRGFNYGIDFKGGRTYVVRLDQDVQVADVQSALEVSFETAPEVKTFGANNQIRITTTYKIEDSGEEVDNEVNELLIKGLQDAGMLDENVSFEDFTDKYLLSSQKVGPTISADIRRESVIAITFALLVIFLYILVRFTRWQYGLGAVIALSHDAIIILGIFSLLYSIMPFSLEIDQAFIAAILTILGYSINDTVVIFDRIREYLKLYPKRKFEQNLNESVNSTLRRTMSTSLSTFVVLLAIFLFGGTTIRGFTFALLIGVVVGTYSSIFLAAPLAYDFQKKAVAPTEKKKR
jgi:SecD/SecF fusion protein